ncbi:MAG: protein kinase domain-containing protein, partial [Actinomadura sp.]
YVVTRFVPGRPLDQVVAEHGPLRGTALRSLTLGLAKALVAIHEAGVVHRDLKPSNVMLVDGEPVVIDFGIAQALDSTRLTLTGMVAGTPGYVAPEVFDEERASPASDVHAWGATVVFAATGRPPFGRGTIEAVFYNIMNGRAQLDGVPEPLLPIVRSALNRDPTWRPSSPALTEAVAGLVMEPAGDNATVPDAPAPPPVPMPPPPPAHAAPQGAPPVTTASQPPATVHPGMPQQGIAHQLGPHQQPPAPARRRLSAGQRWFLIISGVLAVFGLLGGGFVLLNAVATGGDPASNTTPSQQPSVQVSVPDVVTSPEPTVPTGLPTQIEVPGGETVLPTQEPGTTPPKTPTRRPRPTGTSSASSSPSPQVVTPGAFCAPEGATGVTSAGTPMRCTRKAGEDQPRWRSAE